MRALRAIGAAAFFLGLAACQTQPTNVTESGPRFAGAGSANAGDSTPLNTTEAAPSEPIALTGETVVIDARRPFDFASSRIPRSLSMQWSDFTLTETAQRGILRADLFEIARRLARGGIDRDTPVVVVGYGQKGEGEEGRIAWMLRYLGIKKVRFASLLSFPGPFTSRNPFPSLALPGAGAGEPSPRNAPIWKPSPDPVWLATRAEVRDVISRKGLQTPLRAGPHASPKLYAFLDVRPARDFLGQEGFGAAHEIPNLGAVNVPWLEFIDAKGRVTCAALGKLAHAGVTRDKRVIAFDEYGVASGAVALALRTCGYPDVANYAGGLRDLLDAR